jgi:hypothetical protein
LVLTIDGKADLVVRDADAYQGFLDRVEAIERIQRELADVKAGRRRPVGIWSAAPEAWHTVVRSRGTRTPIPKSCISGPREAWSETSSDPEES